MCRRAERRLNGIVSGGEKNLSRELTQSLR